MREESDRSESLESCRKELMEIGFSNSEIEELHATLQIIIDSILEDYLVSFYE